MSNSRPQKGNKPQRIRVGIAALAMAALGNTAFAQVDDFNGIMDIICTVQNFMSGPIAIAIGIVILAIGGLMIAFGGKRSIPFVIWGIIGVSIALAAPSLFTTLTNQRANCEGGRYRPETSLNLELDAPLLAELPAQFNLG